MRRRPTLLAGLAGLAVSATLVGTALPAQAATHDPVPARQGAGWLIGQLTNGLVYNDQFDFDDIGLSADAAIELAALGGHGAAVGRIAAAVAPQVAGYYSSTYNGVTTTYAGSLAKAAVLAEVAGADPASFGGQDLVGLLEQRVSHSGVDRGRIHDENNSYGDANVLGQALAVRALAGAPTAEPATATAVLHYLLTQQCASGYFPQDLASADSTAQSCDARGAGPNTDATAYALIQLQALRSPSAAVTKAIADGRAWLRTQQRSSGAWGGGATTTAANSNSTGLAGWALGDTASARRAAVWLRQRQVRDAGQCGTRLAAEKGAVAYDTAALRAARGDGITAGTQDQWRRAGTQALVALTRMRAASRRISVSPARTTVRRGATIRVVVRHAAPYSMVCIGVGGHHVARYVHASGWAAARIAVPQRFKHHRQLSVVDSDRRRDAVTLTVRR